MSVMHQTLVYATAFIYIVLYRCSNQAAAEVKMCGRFICDQYVYLYSLVLPTCLLRDAAKYWVCLNDVKQFHVTTHDTKEVCCAVYVRMIVIDIFCCLLLSRLNFASLLSQMSLRDSSRIVLKRILVARLNIHHNSFELCLTYILLACVTALQPSLFIYTLLQKYVLQFKICFFCTLFTVFLLLLSAFHSNHFDFHSILSGSTEGCLAKCTCQNWSN